MSSRPPLSPDSAQRAPALNDNQDPKLNDPEIQGDTSTPNQSRHDPGADGFAGNPPWQSHSLLRSFLLLSIDSSNARYFLPTLGKRAE